MGLTKYKLGQLIKQSDVRNSDGLFLVDRVRGISTGKEFIDTKANMDGVSLTSYKIVNGGQFAYVADTSRRGDKIAIAYNNCHDTILISSIYTVFYISKKELLLPEYLFMYFNRPEFDRYSRYNSWGSARETFSWEDMCDIDLELPSIEVQQKYVDIYNGLIENQKSYENGLDDLKLTCDAYINRIGKSKYCKIGDFIVRNQKRNENKKYSKSNVKGFNNEGQFIKPMRLFSGDVSTFKIISKNDFVYNSRINDGIKRLSIAINDNDDFIVSPAYESFYIKDENELLPFYLYMLLQNENFARKVLYHSFGSSTIVFGLDILSEFDIPVPSFEVQKSIADIYYIYKSRKSISELLKQQIKDICPILIKGSIEEGKKEA